MLKIEIDDDVYEALGKLVRGFELPNDVLRRILNLPPPNDEVPNVIGSKAGALGWLIEKGVIKPGDELTHIQVRRGRTFVLTVEADGWIRTELGRSATPSKALGGLVGTSVDGWAHLTHAPSGKTLRVLRFENGGGTGRRAS